MVIQVKNFTYRRPRHRTDIPVLVRLTPVYSIPGRGTDVSAEGIGVRLDEPPPPDSMVVLEFVLKGRTFHTPARLQYRSESNYYGFMFQFSSELERNSLQELLGAIYKIK